MHILSIKHTTRKSYFSTGYVLCICLLSGGCNLERNSHESSDVAAFQQVVELDLPLRLVRWEVFGTPEYSIGVPGPTDFVTLIAEVPSLDELTLVKRPQARAMWIVPGAARPWLSGGNRSMLAKFRNISVDFSRLPNCRVANGKLRKTGEQVHGFICNGPVKVLIYLTLADLSST